MDDDALEQKKQECVDFMNTLIDMARERDISPKLLMRLFGLVGRYLIDANGLGENHTRALATLTVMGLFTEGLTAQPGLNLATRNHTH